MPLQDVSNDPSLIDWLRQSGHGGLLDDQQRFSNTSSSPAVPMIGGTHTNIHPQMNSFNQSQSYGGQQSPQMNSFNQSQSYGGQQSPQMNSFNQSQSYGGQQNAQMNSFNQSQSYGRQQSPQHFISSPTQFLAPNRDYQLDSDIENMRRDPNTHVIQRPPQGDVVYKQKVFVRYLQPPTPPVGGTIIVREKRQPAPPPEPPIVIKRAPPPPPPTPPPVIIRERPPIMPAPEGPIYIDKIVPPAPRPPRQVIIEQHPPLPPKPQDVIIERWLPVQPRQRRILYERLPAPDPCQQTSTRPILVQYGQPRVQVHREVFTAPGAQFPFQQVTGHTDINQILSQVGGNQQIHSTLPSSSLVSYNPYSSLQQSYGSIGQPQSNIVIMQGGHPSSISSSSYGMPLTCVCTPNQIPGLGGYGTGISTIPTMGQSAGQSTVYNVPGNVPIDNILRQLGIDPHSLQQSTDPHSALSNVWNAPAAYGNPPHQIDPRSAVSHVWNAAAHAADHNQSGSAAVGHVWDNIEHYLHPQSGNSPHPMWNQQSPSPGGPNNAGSGVLSHHFGGGR